MLSRGATCVKTRQVGTGRLENITAGCVANISRTRRNTCATGIGCHPSCCEHPFESGCINCDHPCNSPFEFPSTKWCTAWVNWQHLNPSVFTSNGSWSPVGSTSCLLFSAWFPIPDSGRFSPLIPSIALIPPEGNAPFQKPIQQDLFDVLSINAGLPGQRFDRFRPHPQLVPDLRGTGSSSNGGTAPGRLPEFLLTANPQIRRGRRLTLKIPILIRNVLQHGKNVFRL